MSNLARRVLARYMTGARLPDPWVDRKFVAKFCPACAESMRKKGIRAIRASTLFGRNAWETMRTAAEWETLPVGWTDESLKQFWDSIGGSVTKCMAAIDGHVDDPGAFCAALKDRIKGTTAWRGK